MMLEFLNHYPRAINLDNARFDHLFLPKAKRSDFLLFDESTVCEYKEIINFGVSDRIEHISKKAKKNDRNFKRDFYNTINLALSAANKQIQETKAILGTPNALGLIIIENKIPEHLSVLALIDAAERKMMNGLEFVDAVLCLDLVNTFTDKSGSPIRLIQTLTRDSERSKKLYNLAGELLSDYCASKNTPIYKDFSIIKGDQTWITGPDGRYEKFVGTFQTQNNPLDPPRDP
jgi:hypothetical protein